MSQPPFPTTLAQLQQRSPSEGQEDLPNNQSIYKTLRELRTSTVTLHNRLRSIRLDSEFVQMVSGAYGGLSLVANSRCGDWYIPPQLKKASVYFKSTDGHYGCWDFSLRRLNLGLLDILGEEGGCVLVDSTRTGKTMSDALRWTVPIWVAVINRCLFGESQTSSLKRWEELQIWEGGRRVDRWQRKKDGEEEMPTVEDESIKRIVERIEERMDGFIAGFLRLHLDLHGLRRRLKKPIKILWEVNRMHDLTDTNWPNVHADFEELAMSKDGEECDSNLLILCSASRRVTKAESSEGGYVQGAADDSESWSHDLTPETFWNHADTLLNATPNELPELIVSLLGSDQRQATTEIVPVLVRPTKNIYITQLNHMRVDVSAPETSKTSGNLSMGSIKFDLIINCNLKDSTASPQVLDLACRHGKLGSKDLRDRLPIVKSFVSTNFERNPDCRILITCSTGKDLCVGVAVLLLCVFFDDSG